MKFRLSLVPLSLIYVSLHEVCHNLGVMTIPCPDKVSLTIAMNTEYRLSECVFEHKTILSKYVFSYLFIQHKWKWNMYLKFVHS